MFKVPEKLRIKGGKAISGNVDISGAKNSVMGLMAAALLTNEKVLLKNVPFITDVLLFGSMMTDMGISVKHNPELKELEIIAEKITTNIIPAEASKKIRTAYYLWAALLARFAITKEFDSLIVANPGGCKFGDTVRKFDFTVDLLKEVLGVSVEEKESENGEFLLIFKLPAKCEKKRLTYVSTARISHGATCNFILASIGCNTISMLNAAMEPEIADLINMLKIMGNGIISITGRNSAGIVKTQVGAPKLLKGCTYIIMPDRLEASTYALLAVLTKGEIFITGCDEIAMEPVLFRLRKFAEVRVVANGIYVSAKNIKEIPAQKIICAPYPGDETDMQQIWAPILMKANGISEIIDPLWIGRTVHLTELEVLGGKSYFEKISKEGIVVNSYTSGEHAYMSIDGHKDFHFTGANVVGPDLRGTCALIWAGCEAIGTTEISNCKFAIRGYPNIVKNLRNLGVDIEEVGFDDGASVPLLPTL